MPHPFAAEGIDLVAYATTPIGLGSQGLWASSANFKPYWTMPDGSSFLLGGGGGGGGVLAASYLLGSSAADQTFLLDAAHGDGLNLLDNGLTTGAPLINAGVVGTSYFSVVGGVSPGVRTVNVGAPVGSDLNLFAGLYQTVNIGGFYYVPTRIQGPLLTDGILYDRDRQTVTSAGPVQCVSSIVEVNRNGAVHLDLAMSGTNMLGRTLRIKDVGGFCSATNTITIAAYQSPFPGHDYIDGQASIVLTTPYASVTLYNNGDGDVYGGGTWSILSTGSAAPAPASPHDNENHTPDIDGTRVQFTTAVAFALTTTKVFLNGIRQELGYSYTEASDGLTFTFTDAPVVGDRLWLDYQAA